MPDPDVYEAAIRTGFDELYKAVIDAAKVADKG